MSLVIAPIAFALPSPPASAQGIPVYDSSNYLQALSTVSNTLKMVQQGETAIATANTQLQSLQKLTNVNSVATSLIDPRCAISCPPPRWTRPPCWRAT
jgi:type IV secretion system protein VirB5